MKNKTIEAEGGELILSNEAGDHIIIPRDKRQEVLSLIEKKDFGAIDKIASTLPVDADYAQDGTLIVKNNLNTDPPYSTYRPTKSEDPNAKYFSVSGKEDFYKDQENLNYFWSSYYERDRTNLNGYLTDSGEDEKGKYISLYKREGGFLENLFSDPKEYYDRIYQSDLENLKKERYDSKVEDLYNNKKYKQLSRFIEKDKTINEIEESADDYEAQRDWVSNYIKSPMYKEILTNEYIQSKKNKNEVGSEINKRYNRVKNAKIKEKQIHPEGYGYIRGMAFSQPDKDLIDEETGKRLVNIKEDPNSPIPNEKDGTILIDPMAKYQDTSIATHEIDHISTRGTKDMTNYAINKILESTNKDEYGRNAIRNLRTGRSFGYSDDPTEVKARLTELKYLMHKYDIYDPMSEKMNKDHLMKMMSNPHIKKKLDVEDLFETLEGKGDLIDLMNTIAFSGKKDDKNNYA